MEMGLLGGGKGGSGKGAVLKNTEKEYNRAVKNGELKGNDKAAMRATEYFVECINTSGHFAEMN